MGRPGGVTPDTGDNIKELVAFPEVDFDAVLSGTVALRGIGLVDRVASHGGNFNVHQTLETTLKLPPWEATLSTRPIPRSATVPDKTAFLKDIQPDFEW
jgi:hypothetical protein